jgi:chromosome segregation ATPase
MPRIESVVEKIAESTSTRITDVAVNRIGEELKIVESRTTEQTQVIAARIKADSEAAFETVHRVIGESREKTEKTAQELRDLQLRAKDSWKKVQLELMNVNEGRGRLERQLRETEGRLTQSQQQLSDTISRLEDARKEHAETRQQLETTAGQLAETQKTLVRSQQELGQTRQDLAAATQRLGETQSNLMELKHTTQQNASSLASLCSSLEKRLEELERPKGIRALFSRFKGGKKSIEPTDDLTLSE